VYFAQERIFCGKFDSGHAIVPNSNKSTIGKFYIINFNVKLMILSLLLNKKRIITK